MKKLVAVVLVLMGFAQASHAAYYRYENCANVVTTYPWRDISATGTTVSLADDGTSAAVNLGFTLNFGGTNYTQLRIGSNGWMFFGTTATTYVNTALSSAVDAVLMPFWDDLNPGSVATRVRYQTLGSAPNRVFVVSFLAVPHYCGGGTGCTTNQTTALVETFQIQLYETSNEIIFSYGAMSTLGGGWTTGPTPSGGLPELGATIGVEIANTDFTQFSFDTDSVTDNSAIRFFSSLNTPVCTTSGTRLYMQNAVPDVTIATHRGAWDNTGSVLQRKLSRTKAGAIASLGIAETSTTNNFDVLILKMVSEPITTAQTISGTLNWVVGNLESSNNMNGNWHVHVYVTQGNTDNLRGTLYTDYTEAAGTNEWPTTATADGPTGALTLSSVAVSANDRVVIEVGYVARNTSATSFTGTLWYGGTNVSDLALAGDETTYPGYWEFSQNLFPPISVDHYELSQPSTGITCLPSTLTVTACADSSSPCTNSYAGVSGQTATLAASAGTLGATNVTFNASGVATTTLSYPAAADGATSTVTLSGETTVAGNPRRCCPDGTSCAVGNSCVTTFNTAGFIFSASAGGAAATIPSQVAGTTSSTYYLRAVRTSTTTQRCESALAGAQSVNIAYECNNPTTCSGSNLMSVNGGAATTVQRNNNGSALSYTAVNMTFDANGNAPFTFNFSDVGQTTLHASRVVNSATLLGNTNAFVTRPHHFGLSAIKCTTANAANCGAGALAMGTPGDNPAAANAAGASFIQAGNPFSVTVTSFNTGGTATPNYGRETVAEGVTLTSTLVLPLPASGINPAIANASAFGAFTNGVATGTTFSWSEVGIITLTPSVADSNYLGAGNVTGTVSGNVGRFFPAYFNAFTAHGCSGIFSYSGGPFLATVSAYSVSDVLPLQNFDNTRGFSKTVTISNNAGSTANFSNNTIAAPAFLNGVGSTNPIANLLTGPSPPMTYTFPVKETAPLTLTIRATDTDGSSSNGHTEQSTTVRSGRLQISNIFGSELVALPVPMRVQYYVDASTGFITNASDGCTSIPATLLSLSNGVAPTPVSPPTAKRVNGAITTSATVANVPVVAGDTGLSFSAPGAGGSGYVDVTANLATLPWLQYDWDGNATLDNPQGRTTFGVYKGIQRQIYVRERQ